MPRERRTIRNFILVRLLSSPCASCNFDALRSHHEATLFRVRACARLAAALRGVGFRRRLRGTERAFPYLRYNSVKEWAGHVRLPEVGAGRAHADRPGDADDRAARAGGRAGDRVAP